MSALTSIAHCTFLSFVIVSAIFGLSYLLNYIVKKIMSLNNKTEAMIFTKTETTEIYFPNDGNDDIPWKKFSLYKGNNDSMSLQCYYFYCYKLSPGKYGIASIPAAKTIIHEIPEGQQAYIKTHTTYIKEPNSIVAITSKTDTLFQHRYELYAPASHIASNFVFF